MNEYYEIHDQEYYEDFMNELMLDEYLMEKAMEKEYVNNYEEYLEYVESVKDQLGPFGLLPEIVTIRDARDPKKLKEQREAENNDQEAYEDLQNELALDEYLMEKAEAKKELTFEEREEIQR